MSTTEARTRSPKRRLGDLVFANLALGAGLIILVALAGVAIFLTIEGVPAFRPEPDDLSGSANFLAYVWPLVFGTLLARPCRARHRGAAGHRCRARGLALRAAAARHR